jgi:predicted glycoside hydrolase/deacetylase ChbG (UPF0249 family)
MLTETHSATCSHHRTTKRGHVEGQNIYKRSGEKKFQMQNVTAILICQCDKAAIYFIISEYSKAS